MNSSSFAPSLEPEDAPVPQLTPTRLAFEDLLTGLVPNGTLLSPGALGRVTTTVAARRDLWGAIVIEDDGQRWHVKLHQSPFFDVWLLGWQRSQETDWHDHGGSAGSFAVAGGALLEQFRRPGNRRVARRELAAGSFASFGPTHVHNVRHAGAGQALSIHAYSPPLIAMTYYELGPFGLTATETLAVDSPEGARTRSPARRKPGSASEEHARSIGDLLDEVRGSLDRLGPEAAFAEIEAGAVLVDIRSPEERLAEGEIAGA
ncbi:MAG TPA: cysteine dioxygenase family protein, partial [Acidimicrobiales bacterium]|nr:cysteine dioxygenase family protein [Acidimicrobiales bacterium]